MIRYYIIVNWFLVTVFTVQFFGTGEAIADWLDPAWSHRSTVSVSNPGGTQLSNFQVHLSLDSTFDFSNAKTDGSDVRITSDNGSTLLPFWIESWNDSTKTASVWIKVPSIPPAGSTFYLYYGNPTATSASNGQGTFEFFDDFESSGQIPGYFQLSAGQTVLVQDQSWEGSAPHTLSVIENAGGGYTYWGYYGLQGYAAGGGTCSVGVGLAFSSDMVNWTKYTSNPLISNGRWPSVLKVGNTIYMLYTKDFCSTSNIVLASSANGINFTDIKTIVQPKPGFANQNPNLFFNTNDGKYYIYWYYGDGSTFWEIRARSAITPEGLNDQSSEAVVLRSNNVLAAPNMLFRDGTYFLSTEILDSNGQWATQIYSSSFPTSGFSILPGNPVLFNEGAPTSPPSGSACNFQHVIGTELHDYYCKATNNTWTIDHRVADLTAGRLLFQEQVPYPSKWSASGGSWTGLNDTQQDGSTGGVVQGTIGSIGLGARELLLSKYLSNDYVFEAYAKLTSGNLMGLGVRATDKNNLYTVNLYEVLDAFPNLYLYSWIGGTSSLLGSTAVGGVDTDTWYKLSVKVHGNSIDVYKDNVLKLQTTSSQYASGSVALYGEQNSVTEYNNVLVRKYASSEPVANLVSSINPVPQITGLDPSSISAGGTAFSLTVTGIGFMTDSVVLWNGSNRPTTYVSQSQLTAAITSGDIAAPGTVQVTVLNPAPGGGASNAQIFTISNEALNQSITKWKGNKQGAVSFTFDDGYKSQFSIGVAALNELGLKGTFFLISDYTSLSAPDNNMASWDNWTSAAAAGQEISSHTRTHPFLSTLTFPGMQDEILVSQSAIDSQITSQKCLTFAYPFGDLNADVQGIVEGGYIAARGIRWGINFPPYDMYNLYADFADEADSRGVTLESQVDLAVQSGQWLITGFHGLDGTGYGPVTEERFRQFLGYVNSKDLWVGTLSSVVKYIRERDAANLSIVSSSSNGLTLSLTDSLNDTIYNQGLTIRSEVPSGCTTALVFQGGNSSTVNSTLEGTTRVIYHDAIPDRGNITITCNPTNLPPIAVNDSYAIAANTTLNQSAPGVLDNDTDAEGAALTAQLVSGPSHGALTLNSNGSFVYTPAANYVGSDSFTYTASDGTNSSNVATVSISVTGITNTPPVAVNDSYTIAANTTLNQSAPGVLDNDTDAEGAVLTAQLVSGPSHGTLTLNTDGSFTYTSFAGYVGSSDSFTYRANDGTSNSNIASVNITIGSTGSVLFSDDFTRTLNAPAPMSPWSVSMGTWTVSNGTLHGLSPLYNYGFVYTSGTSQWSDYSVEGRIQFPTSSFGGGIGGRLNPATGARYCAWIYPDGSAVGSNVLQLLKTRTWEDWTGVPMMEVALPSVGTGWHSLKLVFNGNRIQVYYDETLKIDMSDNNFGSMAPYLSGAISVDMWTYTNSYSMNVDDIAVRPLVVNQAPVAVNDSYSTIANTTMNQSAPGVLVNDSDAEGTTLTAQLVSGASHGTITLNSNGSFVYTPTADYVGSDSFTYATSDGKATSNVATVSITVSAAATLSALSVSPASVTGGTSSQGMVTLTSAAPTGGVVVTLSDNSSAASEPSSVTVPAGSTTATFTITTTTVTTATSVTVSAVYGGVTKTATLTVNPAIALSALSVSPASVTGGTSSQGTVTLTSAAPTGGVVVTLSDNSSAASEPSSVTVPAGSTTAAFTITTIRVTRATTVTVSAKYSGVTKSATLRVNR
jgi:VCBS repeat-containing protein